MKTPDVMALIETTPDADLVAACLAGNRSAFGQIVERYQRLLCSLAYSATGDLAASEDVAQETFLAAWLKLGELREPEKLRAWLCGILRFKISHVRRRGGREPVSGAVELDEARDVPTGEIEAGDAAMAREEQAIMWHALRELPENYREPLVLYYREHRSIEHVAVDLDLTEDTVKQRLSRGRKLLKERALAFVEGALERSAPGKLFTAAVIAALPAMVPTTAKAAGIGAAAAAAGKSAGGVAKTTAFAALLASFTGLISAVITLRMNLDQSRTRRERRAVVVMTASLLGSFLLFIAALFGAWITASRQPEHAALIVGSTQGLIVVFAVGWTALFLRQLNGLRELRSAERLREPDKFSAPVDQVGSKAAEYRSRATFLGVPLVHLRFTFDEVGQPPAFGWIAGGDRAIGLLFAYGGWAVGFMSIGAVNVGVISFGAVSFGLLSLGAICVGAKALGAIAIGYDAVASLSATAWHTAQSICMAWSNWVAVAPVAVAPHANDLVAEAALANPQGERDWLIYCIVVVFLSLVPTLLYAKAVRRRVGQAAADASRRA